MYISVDNELINLNTAKRLFITSPLRDGFIYAFDQIGFGCSVVAEYPDGSVVCIKRFRTEEGATKYLNQIHDAMKQGCTIFEE